MEINKIKSKFLDKKTISDLYKKLNVNIIGYFFVIFLLFIVSLFIISAQVTDSQKTLSKKQILASSQAYNSMLAEKFSIIASSDIFIEYLRAGISTRQHILPDFFLELSLLKSPVFIGMKISTSSGDVIFKSGDQNAETFLTLNVCYLNSQINDSLGDCKYFWTIFINGEEYVRKFLATNRDIALCPSCRSLNMLNIKNFGTFSVNGSSAVLFNGAVASSTNAEILKYFVLVSILFMIFYFWMRRKVGNIFSKYIEKPIQLLTNRIKRNEIEKHAEYPLDELQYLSEQLRLWYLKCKLNVQQQKEVEIGRVAAQVAHDIRSPLMVLKTVLSDLSSLPERKRIDARNAIQRVTDIANNLLTQYRQDARYPINAAVEYHSEPVVIMLESIISEKRIQVISDAIDITLQFSPDMYAVFVCVDIIGFKRVLSNLMNNAIEAFKGRPGVIAIQLRQENGKIILDVQDNGCGISEEKLNDLLKKGGSFDKKEGSGLGLPYAMNKIKEWGGDYSFVSEIDKGTKFEMTLPESKPAEWFRGQIDLLKDSAIIVLDDDEYIHRVWKERLPEDFLLNNQLKLIHFNNPVEFISFVKSHPISKTAFLVDYELGHDQPLGLDVIRELEIGDRATLVTSRYEDEDVRNNCKALGMRIIPKFFAEIIPINMFAPTDMVLIDNEEVIRFYWQESAESWGKSIGTFHEPDDFLRVACHYSKDATIYIDSSLDHGIKGEDFAKTLYEQGFYNLILATGHPKSHFTHMAWLKDVVGKEPPWGRPFKKS